MRAMNHDPRKKDNGSAQAFRNRNAFFVYGGTVESGR
jgi:hypothetical protein